MTRVARPTAVSGRTLNRLILLVFAAIVLLLVGFVALYANDWWRPAGPSMAERQMATFEEAVRKDPQNLNVRLQLAGAYQAANRNDDALAQYNAVLQVQPDHKSGLLGRGQLLQLRGDEAGAAKDFQKIVDDAKAGEFSPLDVQLGQAYFGLAKIKLDAGDAQTSLALSQEALKIMPSDADTLALVGAAYLATGDSKDAIANLRQAVMFVPTGWGDPYTTLGKAYAAAGQAEEAAWANAMAVLAVKDTDKAISELTPLTSGPAAADAETGLGLAFEAKGDMSGAADWYRKAVALDASNFTATAGLGRTTNSGNPHPTMGLPTPSPSTGA
jgi:tetratricopeptide (TPR) repeat protein